MSAELVSRINAAIGKAFASDPVSAIRAQDAIRPFIAELDAEVARDAARYRTACMAGGRRHIDWGASQAEIDQRLDDIAEILANQS